MLAFTPGFDSRFTLGAMVSCSCVVGAALLALAFAGSFVPLHEAGHLEPGSARGRPPRPACEGYWPPEHVCLPLGGGPRAPAPGDAESEGCPQRRAAPGWRAKAEVLRKLQSIEATAREADTASLTAEALGSCNVEHAHFVRVDHFRGLSMSRMAAGSIVGSREFVDGSVGSRVCWPDGFSDHYVAEFDVQPTDAFQRYVHDFDIDAFRDAVSKAKACMAAPRPSAAGAPPGKNG